MQATTATTSGRCCGCSSTAAEHRGQLGSRLLLTPAQRKPVRVTTTPQAFGGAVAVAGGAAGLKGLSNIATAAGVALGAWWLSRELSAVEEVSERDSQGRECPTCDGTGYTDCLCTRWSDGDVGCSSCRGSGKMPCNSCGGSGTGRPRMANLVVDRDL